MSLTESLQTHADKLTDAYEKGDRLEMERELDYILKSVNPSGISEQNIPTFELGKLFGMALVYIKCLESIK